MFGREDRSIDEILGKIEIGNVSDSVLHYMDKYLKDSVDSLLAQWVNADITKIQSDAGVICFHESFRQAIRAHLIISTRMHSQKKEGLSYKKVLDEMHSNGDKGLG